MEDFVHDRCHSSGSSINGGLSEDSFLRSMLSGQHPDNYTYLPGVNNVDKSICYSPKSQDPSEELCQEDRILYKLIAGLHSSISIHIASDYLLDETRNSWGQNISLLYDLVLRYPDHFRNLYFTYFFVLRAVTKAADYLETAEYDTVNPVEDLKTVPD